MAAITELLAHLGFEIDTKELEKLNHKIDGIAESVKLLVGFEVAEKLYHLVHSFANFGEHLESAAIQAGLTAEELQKLQYAASQNAVQADELSGGLARLGRVLFQAQKGSKSATDAFARLGIDREQLAQFSDVRDALYAIQDGIGGVATQQEKLAVVQQLFGRGGSKFLKFLQIGSKATKQFGDEAERVGAIVSAKDIENLANFEDRMSSLGQVIKSFFATIAGVIAPTFTKAIRTLQAAWASNRSAVMEGIKSLAGAFAYYMGVAIVLFREFGKTVHAIIYADGGIVAAIKSVASFLKDYVWQAFSDLFRDIRDANKDGSITSIFTQIGPLIISLTDTVKALSQALNQAFAAFSLFNNADTSKISSIAWLFQKLANIISTVLYGFTQVSDWLNFAFKGGFGEFLAGRKHLDSSSASDAIGRTSAADQVMASHSVLQAMGVPAVTPQSMSAQSMAQVGSQPSGSVTISSPITVNAAPGMDEKALADMVAKKQSDAWNRVLSETDRDHSFGHAY